MKILVLNAGSSSIKYELFDASAWTALASGLLERIGEPDGRLVARSMGASGRLEESTHPAPVAEHREGLVRVLDVLTASGWMRHRSDLVGIGHRVVHGGEAFDRATLVDADVVDTIRSLVPLAPLHNPASLTGIEVALELCPDVPQVAVFDTAFHRTMPPHAYHYALPLALYQEHRVRRYGFHGTSHQYVARRAAAVLGRPPGELNLVTLHLGNGASAAAICGGRSIETSMGMTPTEGLVMGTRCGDLDASVPLFLARRKGMTLDGLERLLNEESGLKGLCGSSDMREVLSRVDAGDPDALLALDAYCHRVKKYVGAYLAVLGRTDAIVFTAGVGENSPTVRSRCCEGLAGLGIALDERRNASESREEREIQADGSAVKVLVVPTDEELEIARQAIECIQSASAGHRRHERGETMKRATRKSVRTRPAATAGRVATRRLAPQRRAAPRPRPERGPLSRDDLRRIDAYWRAANYLSVGQIYLLDNPLLEKPLALGHVKPRLLGHFGTTPGINLVYVHLNRVIRERALDVVLVTGPGHGAPGLVANAWLEGTYGERYPDVAQDREGMRRLFEQFSFPGGIPSHAAPETPGSIHEGGELGYSLAHAFGAAFDDPDVLVVCIVGDGEAETGPLAAAWHSNKFLNPVRDGAVLPILHLNGYKIANPTVLARIGRDELEGLLIGCGWSPRFVEGSDPLYVHQAMAATLDEVLDEIRSNQRQARSGKAHGRPRWPMIVLSTPKGWTGPKTVDGHRVEGTWRSHQVPVADVATRVDHLRILERWMRSYRPRELFDEAGRLRPELSALAPVGTRRIGANPRANGGLVRQDLRMPDFRDYAVKVPRPGSARAEATRVMATFLRDVMKANMDRFRVMSPDEAVSNRLSPLFEVTRRTWMADRVPDDEDGGDLSPDGRVMEILSEHTCLGWLEGYLLTGRHGLFATYEAFSHVVDSMFNQHAKWLHTSREIPWRAPVSSLNILLSSHVWRQDHNGFSHQDPGFIDHVVNKKPDVIRVYLPPDANTLLSVTDHCLRSRDYVNVIVAGKNQELQYLDIDAAVKHCSAGIGIWEWASNDRGSEPDVVMACAGDVPTLETLAAVDLLRQHVPELRIRVVNVVDLMRLQPREEHPHGLSGPEFDSLFTTNKPIIFAYHGYPWLIHRLTYRRTNHDNLHVRGYKEEGTTTTPFDMAVRNDIDRFHLMGDVLDRVPKLGYAAAYAKQAIRDALIDHREYIVRHGEDMPSVRNWRWRWRAGARVG